MLESSIDLPYLQIFIAILVFQIIYILLQWIFIRRSEYLWYLAYMIGMGTYAMMIYDFIPNLYLKNDILLDFKKTFDKALPILSFFFYFRFARAFIGMKENFQVLNRWICRLEFLLLAYIIIDLIWKILGQNPEFGELLFHAIAILLFTSTWILIIALLKKRLRISYFIVFGAVVLNVGNFLAMWMIVRQSMQLNIPFDPFLVNSTAVIIDLLAFTTGLSYKVRLSEIEKTTLNKAYANELINKLELQREMIDIRHHIAKEIHEELGEGISDISIYTGLAQKEISEENTHAKNLIVKIRTRSIEVLATLQDLIWTLSSENTTFKSLIVKIQQMQREELSPNNILCSINYPKTILETNLKLPALKMAVSTCRKIFNVCATSNVKKLDIELSESAILIIVHSPEDGLAASSRMFYERIIDNRLVTMNEYSDKVIVTMLITSYRY